MLNPECNLIRGCGGIAIICNSSLNTLSITGIDHIIAIKRKSSIYSMLVVGVYFPTTDAPIDDFQSNLLSLENIINDHKSPAVLAGDFNSHVGPERVARASGCQNIHGKLLEMIQNNNHSISSGPSSKETLVPKLTISLQMLNMPTL